jgi:hypothetical protein
LGKGCLDGGFWLGLLVTVGRADSVGGDNKKPRQQQIPFGDDD